MKQSVRMYHPANPLGKAMKGAGGITLRDACLQANENLDAIREECLQALDHKIAQIEKALGDLGAFAGSEELSNIYTFSNQIFGEAGALGLVELSDAARSLCNLTSIQNDAARIDTRMIRLHVDAMQLLRRPDASGDPKIRADAIRGLQQLTTKAGANRTAAKRPDKAN